MLEKAKQQTEQGGFSWRSIMGIVCMLGATVGGSGVGVVGKLLYKTTTITAYELIYFRMLIPVVVTIISLQWAQINVLNIPRHQAKNLLIRVVITVFNVMLAFWALKLMNFFKYISLALLSLLNSLIAHHIIKGPIRQQSVPVLVYVYPLITQILAYFLLGEHLTVFDGFSCLLSFSGVLMIAIDRVEVSSNGEQEAPWAFVVPLACALFSGLGDVYQRKLKDGVHYLLSPIYMCYGCAVGNICLGFINSSLNHVYTVFTVRTWLLLLLISAFGLLGTGLYAAAFDLSLFLCCFPLPSGVPHAFLVVGLCVDHERMEC